MNGMSLQDILGWAGLLRYGVPTEEKERIAISRALPGSPKDTSADQAEANRYAAGFLFGLRNPTIAEYVQPLVSRIKVSDLPFVGGASPELQSLADYGVTQGIQKARMGSTLGDLIGGMKSKGR